MYYVYIIELDETFRNTPKAKRMNPLAEATKPCVYVGFTSKTPEQRFIEHTQGLRTKKGNPLFSRIVKRYGTKLLPDLCKGYADREEALKAEISTTEEYRKMGYTVWSN